MPNLYCVKCKKATANKTEPVRVMSRNNRAMLQTTCKSCGTKKVQFTK